MLMNLFCGIRKLVPQYLGIARDDVAAGVTAGGS